LARNSPPRQRTTSLAPLAPSYAQGCGGSFWFPHRLGPGFPEATCVSSLDAPAWDATCRGRQRASRSIHLRRTDQDQVWSWRFPLHATRRCMLYATQKAGRTATPC
jgi:hypothetical protein